MSSPLSRKWFGLRKLLCNLIGHYATPYPGTNHWRTEPLRCHYCLKFIERKKVK